MLSVPNTRAAVSSPGGSGRIVRCSGWAGLTFIKGYGLRRRVWVIGLCDVISVVAGFKVEAKGSGIRVVGFGAHSPAGRIVRCNGPVERVRPHH
jgi:hypothetical protein